MCSMWEFAPGQTQICAEENHSVGVEVVRGTFSFKFQTGMVGRIRQRWDLNVGNNTHQNGCRFNSAAPSLFIYLVGAKFEEFSGNLSEIMILTHHILPGLLKTKPVSANKQKNELLRHNRWLQWGASGACERSTDLVHLYQLSVRPRPLDGNLHNVRRRRHVCVVTAICKNQVMSKKSVMTDDWQHIDAECKISPLSFTTATACRNAWMPPELKLSSWMILRLYVTWRGRVGAVNHSESSAVWTSVSAPL